MPTILDNPTPGCADGWKKPSPLSRVLAPRLGRTTWLARRHPWGSLVSSSARMAARQRSSRPITISGSSFASGAKGILVYSHYHASDQNGMLLPNLQVLGQAAGQLNAGDNSSSLAMAILNGQPVSGVTASVTSGPAQTVSFTPTGTTTPVQYPSIHVWAQQFSNRTYLIAVNSTDQSVSAQVAGLPVASGTAKAPAESRSLPISGGAFRDRDG